MAICKRLVLKSKVVSVDTHVSEVSSPVISEIVFPIFTPQNSSQRLPKTLDDSIGARRALPDAYYFLIKTNHVDAIL
jgi:hypothetical protein